MKRMDSYMVDLNDPLYSWYGRIQGAYWSPTHDGTRSGEACRHTASFLYPHHALLTTPS